MGQAAQVTYTQFKTKQAKTFMVWVSLTKQEKLHTPTVNRLLSIIPPVKWLQPFFQHGPHFNSHIRLNQTLPFHKYPITCSPHCQPNIQKSSGLRI